MNQSQFVHKVMELLFGDEYEYLNDSDCSYELAIGMIEEKFSRSMDGDSKSFDLEETSNKEALQRQSQRLLNEESWRAGYDVLTEGALGDYPEE